MVAMKKTKRIPTWVKQAVAAMIERYFGAKGYTLDRKALRSRGPRHLRVRHVEKDHDQVLSDWQVINAFATEHFGWAPTVRLSGYHHDALIIETGNI